MKRGRAPESAIRDSPLSHTSDGLSPVPLGVSESVPREVIITTVGYAGGFEKNL